MTRRMFPELVADATCSGEPWETLELAIRITRWRMIARLEIVPHAAEPLPLEVRHARDRAQSAMAA